MSFELENNLFFEREIFESFINENSLFEKFYSNFSENEYLYTKEELEKIKEYITK